MAPPHASAGVRTVGVSAATGAGIESLFDAVEAAKEEYERDVRPILIERRERQQREKQRDSVEKLRADGLRGVSLDDDEEGGAAGGVASGGPTAEGVNMGTIGVAPGGL